MSHEEFEYVLRPAEEQDTPFLYELFCESRKDEFAPLGLTPEALEPLLTMQFRARKMGYEAQFPEAKSSVVSVGGQPAGTMVVDYGDGALRLVDIAVSGRFQRRGLGKRMLAALVEEARSKGVALRLSVRFDNPALRLYERLGFVRTGGDGLSITMEKLPGAREEAQGVLPVEEKDEGAAESMSSGWFRRLAGQKLAAWNAEGVEVKLVLRSVAALPSYGMKVQAGDSFTLEFIGPLTPMLTPAVTSLKTAGGEEISLFLSPTGPHEGAMRYEAIFNRMRWADSSSH